MLLIGLHSFAQDTLPTAYYYYVEEKTPDLLKPTTQKRNADHTLDITFSKTNLQSFFDSKTVYVYKKAFPGAINTRLQNMYLVGLDDDNVVNQFRSLNEVVYSDYIGTLDDDTLGLPDDYESTAFIPTQNIFGPNGSPAFDVPGLAKEHLDLVNAPRAWNITTGNPNIAIGIIDVKFTPNHPDLVNKITNHYGSYWTDDPNQIEHPHGVKVAGTAAADTNNGIGISSIGYNSSLVTLNRHEFPMIFIPDSPHPFDDASTDAQNALFLVQNHPEIKVINYSHRESCNFISAHHLLYKEIWDNYNVTIVAASGNGNWLLSCPDNNGGDQGYVYPASYDHVISVSTVGHHYKYGTTNDFGKDIGWKDVHEFIAGNSNWTFTHNDKVDIVAPGYYIPTTNDANEYGTGRGTSFSSPFITGVVALMYAAHPNITPDEVKQILLDTAVDIYHIPENQPYFGLLGEGRVNAYAAVRQADCLANPTTGIDLMTRNSDTDFGDEPDNDTDPIWESTDIWVRNQQDPDRLYKDCHEDLQYVDDQTPVYVYVRVTNDGCGTSSGNDELKLYWAKGGLSQTWPTVWDGSSNPTNGFDIGDVVGVQNIPALETGESTILEFQWFPQDPEAYENAGFIKPWMFCFLSRIVSTDDPMTSPEVSNAATNTRNNNNIAYKNTTVINVSETPSSGTIFAGNLGGETPLTSNIQFFTNDSINDAIWQEAEIYATLDENLWNAWQDSGAQNQSVRVANSNERRLLLTGNNASLDNINFESNRWGTLTMSVNFLVRVVEDFEGYDLLIQQTESNTDDVLGGFTYTFTRDNSRQEFIADNETEVEDDNIRTIKAVDINEPAIYNWYDEDGNLIYSGDELEVSTAVANEYKLEVIAESDGHKDYQTLVTDDLREIESISPNPAQSQVNIKYLIDEQDNVMIKLTHSTNGIFYNYILDNTQDSIDIDLTNFTSGQYIVNLISGGQILDTQNLIIN